PSCSATMALTCCSILLIGLRVLYETRCQTTLRTLRYGLFFARADRMGGVFYVKASRGQMASLLLAAPHGNLLTNDTNTRRNRLNHRHSVIDMQRFFCDVACGLR